MGKLIGIDFGYERFGALHLGDGYAAAGAGGGKKRPEQHHYVEKSVHSCGSQKPLRGSVEWGVRS